MIDGTSEPDYTGSPVVVLDGSNVSQGSEQDGLFLNDTARGSADDSDIRGLVIQHFPSSGIRVYTSNNTIEGNWIIENGEGILNSVEHDNWIIDNVISGNAGTGITVTGNQFGDGDRNVILRNFIGTDVDGTGHWGNGEHGVWIQGASENTIVDNVISGNGGSGVVLNGALWWTQMNTVQRNRIGTDTDGTAPLPNAGHGVWITGGYNRLTTIGGFRCRRGQPVNCQANTIAYNEGAGVFVGKATQSFGHAIRGNAIFHNGGLGIDLGIDPAPDGVTPNDPLDDDEGPNLLQNFPVLIAAHPNGLGTTVYLTLDFPHALLHIDFYVNDGIDHSWHGEGQRYLTSKTLPASWPVSTWVTVPWAPPGKYITATATDANGDTSEFSNALQVSARREPASVRR